MRSNYNYDDYNTLSGIRDRAAQQIKRIKSDGKVLDVGCGTGEFSIALATTLNDSKVLGIDIVENYIKVAIQKSNKEGIANIIFLVKSIFELTDSKFSMLTHFLSICELLKSHSISEVIKVVNNLLENGGLWILLEEFEEDAITEHEQLGVSIHKEIGYKYFKKNVLVDLAKKAKMNLIEEILFHTERPRLNIIGTLDYLKAECSFNIVDGSNIVDPKQIASKFSTDIHRLGGIEINKNIRMLIFQKDRNG